MYDIRQVGNPVVVIARRWLVFINARHPWSHNDHFHGWILRRLPRRRRRALEIGCGEGRLLARLAQEFDAVEGTDTDDRMRTVADARCAQLPNVAISGAEFDTLEPGFDLITLTAVLHHLGPVDDVVPQFDRLLAPGGKLLVVGLAPPASRADLAWDIVSALSNPIIGMVKHPRPFTGPPASPPFPVKDPVDSFDELRRSFRRLPGAKLRRRLGFRYTIEWTAPVSP